MAVKIQEIVWVEIGTSGLNDSLKEKLKDKKHTDLIYRFIKDRFSYRQGDLFKICYVVPEMQKTLVVEQFSCVRVAHNCN